MMWQGIRAGMAVELHVCKGRAYLLSDGYALEILLAFHHKSFLFADVVATHRGACRCVEHH